MTEDEKMPIHNPRMTSSNSLFCLTKSPKPKDIQLTMI